MAAVVQCANTSAAWILTLPSSVSSSGNGRGLQCWTPRAARCRKAGGQRAPRRGVVSMAMVRGEGSENCEGQSSAGDVVRFAQKTVVALALGLSLSIGGLFLSR